VNGTIYFTANDGVNGNEIWKSDGTEAGTVMIKDIAPGETSSWAGGFIAIGNVIYFMALEAHGGIPQLWKTDGTAAGTSRVTLNASAFVESRTEFNGELYFTMDRDGRCDELWKIDGVTGNAVRLTDINRGAGGSGISELVNVNGRLFFTANDVVHGQELWVIDPASPSGDFDGDRRVDGADFLAWQRGFGKTLNAVPVDGDADGDHDVDAADLNAWKSQFGVVSTMAAMSANIVEPQAAASLSVAIATQEPVAAWRNIMPFTTSSLTSPATERVATDLTALYEKESISLAWAENIDATTESPVASPAGRADDLKPASSDERGEKTAPAGAVIDSIFEDWDEFAGSNPLRTAFF
jgi:ELWxxDGT repeat protein